MNPLVVSTMQHIQFSCRRTLRRACATLRRSHMIGWAHESTNDTGRLGRNKSKTYVLCCTLVLVGVVHIALSPMQDRARYAIYLS